MKYLFLVLMTLTLFSSCSSDDSSSNGNNEVYQKLLGKWYFSDPSVYGYETNNSFIFSSNGNVTYSYWTGGASNDFDSETGTFSVEGDILTMVYPETVTLTFIQKVEFISDTKVKFIETGNPNEEPYDGTYYKE